MPLTGQAKRDYQNAWMQRRRQEYLDASDGCAVCGSRERLEIDHIDRATKVTHRVWSWSKVRRDAELAKCQVLCYKHHLEKTVQENTIIQHGTHHMYNHHKCRCDECKEAHKQLARETRAAGKKW